jgi:pyrimidine-specific ribonucleoside hydrolase
MGFDYGALRMSDAVHVIVDGGVDDALAIAVLLGLRVPVAQVVATEGSVDLATTAWTTKRLLKSLGSAVPVRLGTDHGLRAPYPEGRDPFHGDDGFGGFASLLEPTTAPREFFERLDGPVFCSGALTTVARAIDAGHEIAEVVWMGGAVGIGGNMTAAAEFNAWMDPFAADLVLSSGLGLRMVPLDITLQFRWSVAELDELGSTGPIGALLRRAAGFVQARDGVFVPHDAVAAIAMTSPQLFEWFARPTRCETVGTFTTGATVVDRRPRAEPGSVLIAEAADVAEITARMLQGIAALESP